MAKDEKETTTEALTRMLAEQEKDKKTRTVTKDGGVVIHHPNNKGMIAGRVKGDFTW